MMERELADDRSGHCEHRAPSDSRVRGRWWHILCGAYLVGAALPIGAAADPVQQVRCAEVRFSLSAEARDAASFRSMIDPDARFTGDEVLRGPEAIVAAWSPFFRPDGPGIKWRPRIVEVLESGDLALTRGPYRLETQGEDGQAVVRWGTFNSVWRLGSDGRWRVVFDTGGPPLDKPTDEARALLEAATTDCDSGPVREDQEE
jgi:ketosteroid isomerase-like protein